MELSSGGTEQRTSKSGILVPLETRQLGEFIANLLGQRRRLSRSFNVNFLIDWPWLHNLDRLIIQRVVHQNDAELVDFSFKLDLKNGGTTHVTSRSDFESFRDISSVETIGVELIWTFLVKFPTSKVPEKQEVRFSAQSDRIYHRYFNKNRVFSYFNDFRVDNEEMAIDVYYTNVTWGDDIISIVSTHVATYFQERSLLGKKCISFLFGVAPIISMLILATSLLFVIAHSASVESAAIKELLKAIVRPVSLETLDAKLEIIASARLDVALSSTKELVLDAAISTLGIVLVLASFSGLEFLLPRSFLMLNDYSSNKRDAYVRKRHAILVVIFLGFLIGTASSIFATSISTLVLG